MREREFGVCCVVCMFYFNFVVACCSSPPPQRRKKKEVKVKVQKQEVKTTGISGLPPKVSLKAGKKCTLKPVLSPITSVQKVTYTTSDKTVASVSSKGVITAKKAGKVKITVKAGTKKSVVTITVKK